MAQLTIEGGPEPQSYQIGEVCRIGREDGNEITLDDPGASRRHCRVSREAGTFMLEDLKSANGTFRNDERVDRVLLVDGDLIKVGATVLLFSLAEAASGVEEEIQLEDPADKKQGDGGESAQLELVFFKGEHAGERFPVSGSRLTLGRRNDNTIIFQDSRVSGVHAEVCLEQGRAVLRDLGSTNGTYLEEKKIDEVVLDHGDRVSLGDNSFALADVTRGMPDVTGADVLDGSQTMLNIPAVKVVHDVTKTPARKSPIAALGMLVVMVALAGAAWFYWDSTRKDANAPPPPPAAGNLLADRWSIEATEEEPDAAAAWDLSVGGGASFEVVSGGQKSGSQALEARVGEQAAEARLRDAIGVSGRKYRISGALKGSASGAITLCALFTGDDADPFEIAIPVGSSDGASWREVQGDVLPPTGSRELRLVLTGMGSAGKVMADDLGVFDIGVSRVESVDVNQFEFERAGEALLVRRGSDLLRLGPLAIRFGTGDDAEVRTSDRFAANNSFLVPGGKSVSYGSSFEVQEGVAVLRFDFGSIPGGSSSAFVPVAVLPALAEESILVAKGNQLEPYQDSFEADGVTGLVFGKGATRMRIVLEPPTRVTGNRTGDLFGLMVNAAEGADAITLKMQVDFVAEKTEAADLAGKARRAQSAGHLGEALSIVDRITNEFPFDEGILADAGTRRMEILRERERLITDLANASERARFLGSPSAFLEAEEFATQAASSFEGTQTAQDFRTKQSQLAEERTVIVKESRERMAELLLRRIDTALSQTPPQSRVAKKIAAFIVQEYPDSKAALEAQARLGGSDGS